MSTKTVTTKIPSLPVLDEADAELVFGLVYAVGTDYSGVELTFQNFLKRFNYEPHVISLSTYISTIADKVKLPGVAVNTKTEFDRIDSLMNAGNSLRELTGRNDFVVAAAVAEISRLRPSEDGRKKPLRRRVHILRSLKRPEEVEALRKIYGLGFYLIGVFATEGERLRYLTRDKNIPDKGARFLIKRDENEDIASGQRTRATFHLADVFVALEGEAYKNQLERFLDLVFGYPYHTPEPDEHAMFLAYSAGLRSAQLGRQVGAALRSSRGDVISVGCNDVPRSGGGLYWPGKDDRRDHVLKYDSNDSQLRDIINDILERLEPYVERKASIVDPAKFFKNSLLLDVTEYGRAVHAEMDAILTASRSGTSPVKGELFTTTFPCHNCTRHVIASGIRRVVYIEPYPKSLAGKLHKDAILIGDTVRAKRRKLIPFEPFVGIGPRRFFDLFSKTLSRGYEVRRKQNGKIVPWKRENAAPRIQMLPTSYLEREQLTAESVRILSDQLQNQGTLL